MATAQAIIYGMDLSNMNRLATLGLPPDETSQNRVLIEAGDVGAVSAVFSGTIQMANVHYEGMPEVAFILEAYSSADISALVIPPYSHKGGIDAASIVASLAKSMGRGFENNGATAILSNPYFPGSAHDQLQRCVKAAGFNLYDDGNTIAIWPVNGMRKADPVLISPQTGLVGYPTYQANGVTFRSLYNSNLVMGRQVKLVSSLAAATGIWTVYTVNVDLEAETPNGAWFQDVTAYPPNLVGTE